MALPTRPRHLLDFQARDEHGNKAGYTATQVVCRLAVVVMKLLNEVFARE